MPVAEEVSDGDYNLTIKNGNEVVAPFVSQDADTDVHDNTA